MENIDRIIGNLQRKIEQLELQLHQQQIQLSQVQWNVKILMDDDSDSSAIDSPISSDHSSSEESDSE